MKTLWLFLFPQHFYTCQWIGAAIAGGAALLGGAMGNSASAKQASNSIAFQRESMTHAHQYQVQDMRNAGLNPILSATGGSGAKASGGAMAQQNDIVTPAVNSAREFARTKQEMDVMKANEKNIATDTSKKDTEIDLNKENIFTQRATQHNLNANSNRAQADELAALTQAEVNRERALTERQVQAREAAQSYLMRHQAALTSHNSRSAQVEADIDTSEFGKTVKHIDRASRAAEGATSAVRNLIPIPRGRR
ncbi:MAG: DNA pilot protein [Wigfec virus K19_161]|nr:MAG: DNA pilot protein [Wigfec virus K19_161]